MARRLSPPRAWRSAGDLSRHGIAGRKGLLQRLVEHVLHVARRMRLGRRVRLSLLAAGFRHGLQPILLLRTSVPGTRADAR